MKNVILTYKLALYLSATLFAGLLMGFTPFVSADFSDGLILHHSYDEGQGSLLNNQTSSKRAYPFSYLPGRV